jgi:type IV pilus assembly protein PilF
MMMFIPRLFFLFVAVVMLVGCNSAKRSEAYDKQNTRTAKINVQLGLAYLEQHNIRRAKQKLLLAVDEAPSSPEAWYSLAYFYEATGNHELADKYYLKAIRIAPKRGDSQNNYGTFLCRTKHYQEAIQHFLIAVHDNNYLNPADAYENAGLCALTIPDKKLAAEYFRRAIMEDPSRPISEKQLAKLEKPQHGN